MNELLHISSNPHIRDKATTGKIMLDVIIALIPATIVGISVFGLKALLLIIVTMISAVTAEAVFQKITHQKITISDGSAALTGLLLALNLPVSLPVWMAVLGAVFAIIVVKQFFGGLGQNFMNPALAGRCFLLISFGTAMNNFTIDGISSATPLANLKSGMAVDISKMFIGTTAGTIGETSAIALLAGALYLLVKKIIHLNIPLAYIASFSIFVIIYCLCTGRGLDWEFLAAHLCGGGLMLGALFMATDYVTSPITPRGRIVFGICLGIMTGLFRFCGKSAEGVSYAIIFCNLLVPIIEKLTIPKAFGREDEDNE